MSRLGRSYDPAPTLDADGFELSISAAENPWALGGSLACLCLTGFVAIISLGAVPPMYVGISYNQFTKAADTYNVYPPGRHLIGPFNQFLLFPSTVQTIEFSNDGQLPTSGLRYPPLHTRTREGLGLHLQVSLQYRLKTDKVGQLYSEFNQNYEQVFVSSVRDTLIKAASEYEAQDLWEERQVFGMKMQDMVNHALAKTYATCWGLQLMVIDLDEKFEKSIVDTQVQKQAMLSREQEQASTRIRAETQVIEAEYQRTVKVITSKGNANYTLVTKRAEASAQQNVIDTEAEVLSVLKASLSLESDGLVLYQKYGALEDLIDSSIFYGFDEDSQVLVRAKPFSR